MKHETQQHQSTLDRIRHSRKARAAVGALAFILAGCGTASVAASGGSPGGHRKATPVATSSRKPGPTPKSTESSGGSLRPATEAQMQQLCTTDSKILNKVFHLGPLALTEQACVVPATPPTPGMPVLRWDINGGALFVTVDKLPGFGGKVIQGFENTPGDKTVHVGSDVGVVRPEAGTIDVGLSDGTVAELVVAGAAGVHTYTNPFLPQAATLLLGLDGINPYTSTLAG